MLVRELIWLILQWIRMKFTSAQSLIGNDSYFLPFDKGNNEGKVNPPNPLQKNMTLF